MALSSSRAPSDVSRFTAFATLAVGGTSSHGNVSILLSPKAATDKAKGAINEAVGKVKQGVGEATDRPDIAAEGHAQEAKGDLQTAKGNVKGVINSI